MQSFDESALLFIQAHLRNDLLTPVMKLFTALGNGGLIWIVLGLGLLLYAGTRKKGLVYALALGGTAVLNNLIIKPLIARPRPYSIMEGLTVLVEKLSSSSFPSGHASSSFAAATALTLLFGRRGAWSFVPAVLITLSRPYLGMHYLTDVLCGAVLGAVCAWAVVTLVRKKTRLGD